MNLKEIFKDISPIPQDDGPNPVCSIDYPNGFVEAMNYLRAILKKNEHSERALDLTGICLRFNPANYTTWWFRRQCLASLSSPPSSGGDTTTKNEKAEYAFFSQDRIAMDLELASTLGGKNPKNYQIWYHRRSLLEHSFVERSTDEDVLALIDEELDYITYVLEEDAKNYHAWSHRQWILKTINVEQKWIEEISYVEELLKEDVRNNSAWNQRWFVAHRGSKSKTKSSTPFSLARAQDEMRFAIEKAKIDPYNESPWKYFIAILKEQASTSRQTIGEEDKEEEEFLKFLALCEKEVEETKASFEVESKKDGMECIHLIAAHVDILEMKGGEDSRAKALGFIRSLESRYDPIRKKYWRLRADKF